VRAWAHTEPPVLTQQVPAQQPSATGHTLIIAPQWIGDAVMSEPLMRLLHARGERLSVAALPFVAPIYRAMTQVDEVIELPFAHGRLDARARWRLARSWRGRFEAAYVLPNSIKSALIVYWAGIGRRVGYHGEGRWGLLNQRLPNPSGRQPMVAHYSALAGTAGAAVDLTLQPQLHTSQADQQHMLHNTRLQAGAYWVLAPGAEYGPAKCWPASHYAQLARALQTEHGLPVLLLGSAKEQLLCQSIADAAPGACQVWAGKTSLSQAMALIANAKAVVSNDSGLMHVAAALGVPQVAIFGSTSPKHTPPLNSYAQVLWLKESLALACAPCFKRNCPLGHTRCLTEITPTQVQLALNRFSS
jgi:heptosyltransferase II